MQCATPVDFMCYTFAKLIFCSLLLCVRSRWLQYIRKKIDTNTIITPKMPNIVIGCW